MFNPGKLFQIKSMWTKFCGNHPRFQPFLQAVGQTGVKEGSIFEITVTTPEGQRLTTNLKLKEDDIEMIESLKGLF